MGDDAQPSRPGRTVQGVRAILGMDIVSYSTFSETDQLEAVRQLMQWLRQALRYRDIDEDDYVWSHAGDGGYLTFVNDKVGPKALDVAFDLARRVRSGEWAPASHDRPRLRMGLHAGLIQTVRGLGLDQLEAVSGVGINTTARVVSVSATDQLLVSRQYWETYGKDRRKDALELGPLHTRSVKHGVKIEVMNADLDGLFLGTGQAAALQWEAIGGLWRRMADEYAWLAHDSLRAGSPLTAMAAAHYLLRLGQEDEVRRLCLAIGSEGEAGAFNFPVVRHELFGHMPADALLGVIEMATPRVVSAGEVFVTRGDPADTCFFVVSGRVEIQRPGGKDPIPARLGELVGEFGLWMSHLRRTATLVAREKSLIIQIPIARFRAAVGRAGCADIVHNHIRKRVRSNVLGIPELFAGVRPDPAEFPTDCERYDPGAELDLSSRTYFLFNGRVEIAPPGAAPLVVAADGQAAANTVVGIWSRIGRPDGPTARVLDETVAVSVAHDRLRAVQQKYPIVGERWNALCGMRLGSLEPEALG